MLIKCRDEPAALMEREEGREAGRQGEKERREGERRERERSVFISLASSSFNILTINLQPHDPQSVSETVSPDCLMTWPLCCHKQRTCH